MDTLLIEIIGFIIIGADIFFLTIEIVKITPGKGVQ